MALFIGIDGGGTETSFAAIDSSGKLLSSYTGSCANHNSVGDDEARRVLTDGIAHVVCDAEAVLRTEGIENATVGAITCGCSGVDRPEDEQRVRSYLQTYIDGGAKVYVYNDAVPALAAGTGGLLEGVCVISGTGTVTYSYRVDPQRGDVNVSRNSGWGPTLGGQGGGHCIGRDVLCSVCCAADGRDAYDLIPWAYSAEVKESFKPVAQLSKVAAECYRAGDAEAQRIFALHAKHLVHSVKSIDGDGAQRTVVVAGGNFVHDDSPLLREFKQQLESECPGRMSHEDFALLTDTTLQATVSRCRRCRSRMQLP